MTNSNKKRRYPSGRIKLHAMKDRLEMEIAERQDQLEEVTRLARQADNTAIVGVANNYNVTPEQFEMLVRALQSGTLDTEALAATLPSEQPVAVSGEVVPTGNVTENEHEEMEILNDDEQ